MFKKRIKSLLLPGILSLSLVLGLFTPIIHVTAEEDEQESADTTEETTTEETDTGTTGTLVETPLGELVAHWTFDGNYKETASGLTTNLGAKKLTYTEGIFGQAAVFNGKDNYLTVEASSILNLGNDKVANNDNFTISAWINLGDSSNKYKYLLDKGTNTGWEKNDDRYWSNPYRVRIDVCEPEVILSNEFQDTRSEPDFITEGEGSAYGKHVEGGEWFLLTVTYDGKRIKIYHDNELLTQSNYTNGITFNNDELYIGVDYRLEDYFKGFVDDLRIYTKSLSYDEVDALYQKGLASNKEQVEPTKKLVAYYAFDDNLTDASSFKNNAEKVAVGGTTKYIVGKNGKAITMSKGNYILVPAADQLNFDTEFTISFWLKVNADGYYPILYRQNPCYSDQDDNEYTYRVTIDAWSSLENTRMSMSTSAYDPDSWSPGSGQSLASDFSYDTVKIKSSNWFHYTFTYKNGQMNSYLNGKLQEKSEKSDLINIENAAGDLLIGYDGSTFISGAIDELKIYNKFLTATEVAKEAKRIDSISLSNNDKNALSSIDKGKTFTIKSIILKDGDTGNTSEIKTSDKNVSLRSSNTKIFTVDKNGKITGVKAGNAKLSVTYGGHTITYNVVVK